MIRKRVVLLRTTPVSPDPPVEKTADTLLRCGYDVTIIGWDRGGAEYDTAGKMTLEHGVSDIIRLGVPSFFAGGLKNLVPMAKFQRKLYHWLKAHRNEYDIIHGFDLDTGITAKRIAKKYSKQLIYHILDFYSDSRDISSRLIKGAMKKAEFSVINHADAVIICADSRREQIAGSHPKRLEVIYNTPKNNKEISDCFDGIKNSSRCKIAYVGTLQKSRFLSEIIRFIEKDDRFELHIGGFGMMENEVAGAAEKCSRIRFYGRLPYDKTLALENACDIMTAIYDPSVPNHKYAAPNKLYEALMLGKPLVAAQGTGFDDIIEKNNIGRLIEYTEAGLADGLNSLAAEKEHWHSIGEKMKKLYKEHYSGAEMEKRLAALYAECDT